MGKANLASATMLQSEPCDHKHLASSCVKQENRNTLPHKNCYKTCAPCVVYSYVTIHNQVNDEDAYIYCMTIELRQKNVMIPADTTLTHGRGISRHHPMVEKKRGNTIPLSPKGRWQTKHRKWRGPNSTAQGVNPTACVLSELKCCGTATAYAVQRDDISFCEAKEQGRRLIRTKIAHVFENVPSTSQLCP